MGNYIATVYSKENYTFDYEIGNGGLVTDDGLGTAILNQLFSSSVTVGPYTAFWGNSFSLTPLGSGLVNLLRGIRNGNTSILSAARDYVKAAMQPFLNLGLITSLDVPLPQWRNSNGVPCIIISMSIFLPGANSAIPLLYGINPTSGAYFITQ